MGHLFDVHAAFGRGDDRDAAGLAIDQQSEIEFLRDVDAVGDVEALDLLALRASLDGDERLAEHLLGIGAHFLDRLGEADAALGVGAELGELALAAAAGVDLRLHDPERSGQLLRGLDRFVDGHGRVTGGNRNAELREQLFGLIFVDIHCGPPLSRLGRHDAKPRCRAKFTNVHGDDGRFVAAHFPPLANEAPTARLRSGAVGQKNSCRGRVRQACPQDHPCRHGRLLRVGRAAR